MSIEEKINQIIDKINPNDVEDENILNILGSKTLMKYITPFITPIAAILTESQEIREKSLAPEVTNILKGLFPDNDEINKFLGSESGIISSEITLENAAKIYQFLSTTAPFGQLINLLKAGFFFIATFGGEARSILEKATQEINERDRPLILDINTLTELFFREKESETFVKDKLKKHGITDVDIETFLEMQKNMLPLEAIRTLFFREGVTKEQTIKDIKKLKFDTKTANDIFKTFEVLPSPSELIRWGVREVFNDELRKEFQLDADIPEEFINEMKKTGYSEKNARNAWAAHWVLPSVLMTLRMFQRQIINEEQLNSLLKANDIMPGFRVDIVEMAYNPITRVDIRRLWREGIFTEREQLVKAYRDIGLSPENAEILSDFTEKEFSPFNKDLTKSSILKALRFGLIDEETAINEFIDNGFSPNDAKIIIEIAEIEQEEKLLKKRLAAYKNSFIDGKITLDEVETKLVNEGFNIKFIQEKTLEWETDKSAKTKRINKDDLKAAFTKGIIDKDNVTLILKELHYPSLDIEILIKTWEVK